MIEFLSNARLIATASAGAVAGAVAMLVFMLLYMSLIHDPALVARTRLVVEAETMQNTKDAINAVSDSAERARAMRRYCAGRGILYDFETNQCRE